MAICNLFRSITNKAGTFFMFSEVSKQLTKTLSNPQITIMPSKFVCLNLPDFEIPLESKIKTGNTYFPSVFQNYFENKCAYLPTVKKDGYVYSTKDVERCFWGALHYLYPDSFKINFENKGNNNTEYLQEESNIVTYIGDINIQNYEEYDNIGYSEIFLNIPSDAKPIKNVLFNTNWDDSNIVSDKNIFFDISYDNGRNYSIETPDAPLTILGYPDGLPYSPNDSLGNIGMFDKLGSLNSLSNSSAISKDVFIRPDYYIGFNPDVDAYHYTGLRVTMNDTYLSENVETLNYTYDEDKNSIDFNAILVYFRIVSNDGKNITSTDEIDIPYGIYITSDIETIYDEDTNTTKGHFVNGIKKYVNKTQLNPDKINNEEVYNQQTGSAYALRIIARYLSIPNGTVYPVIEFANDSNIEDISIYSELLSYMQNSQKLMGESVTSIYNIKNTINEIYTGVQQNQFNVPQIFKKGNNYWWYINYKNTGHRANGLSAYEVAVDNGFEGTVDEWLNSLISKNIYTKVLYSSTNVSLETPIPDKKWGDIYPELLETDENVKLTDTYKPGLMELILSNKLIPGLYYEIVDYKTTQDLSLTNTINIPFEPIVVQAANSSTLTGDGYFLKNPDWKIKYTPYNYNDKYSWVLNNSTYGKGVIYNLYNNTYRVSFPYDIFNIYFINPESPGEFIKTFNFRDEENNNININDELSLTTWNTSLENINILPYIEESKQYLNNYIFIFRQTGDAINNFSNIVFKGISNDIDKIEYSSIKNIKFDNIKNTSFEIINNDGFIINNFDIRNIKSDKSTTIKFGNELDTYLLNFNPMVNENVNKEMLSGYYYNETNSEILSRVLIKYVSGDGNTQVLFPEVNISE